MVLVGSRTLREVPRRRIQYGGYIRIPFAVWGVVFLVAFLISLSSSDALLTFACIATVPVLATLVWRAGEPPVPFAALMMQWLQVSAGTFRATITGAKLNDLFHTAGADYATWLSLTGLLVLALGIRLANLYRPPIDPGALYAEIRSFRYSRVFATYCLAQLGNFFLQAIIWSFPGLSQALLAASQLRWLFYFTLVATTLVQKRGYGYLAAATVFEIILGFTSFFADFREVFFVLAVAYLMVQPRMNVKMVATVTTLLCILLYMAVIWSSVKMDYRDFQNQGTGAQVSLVGTQDKLEKLVELIGNVDSQRFLDGIDKLAERIEYTRFFGYVTENVPRYIPYDDGAIWEAAVYHVLTPRLLFADKAELTADIENTIRYTGIAFSGGGVDTEIPLGYMAESYIGFGPIFMFVPILLLGLLFGAQYRYLATLRHYKLFAYAAMPVILMPATEYGLTAVKILGGSLTVFPVTYIVLKLFMPSVQSFILSKRNLSHI